MFSADHKTYGPGGAKDAPGPGTEELTFDARPILPEHFRCSGGATALI